MKKGLFAGCILAVLAIMIACTKDQTGIPPATPYNFVKPMFFPPMDIPEDNPLTEEGIALGRRLFYEEMLSSSNTQSCASCHIQANAFSDITAFSEGEDPGVFGDRNSMALVNVGWNLDFFWDGREKTLEEQIFKPVTNPVEMHQSWGNAVAKLQADETYPCMYFDAFGTLEVDSVLTSKALAQFIRILVSSESKYDRVVRNEDAFTALESEGFNIFTTERGDCAIHCHGGQLVTTQIFSNNGLDIEADQTDIGLEKVTGDTNDRAKFKVPTLRNIAVSGPYMHDGRFETLEEVVEHYSSGVVPSPTIDPNMKQVANGGLQLTLYEKEALVAFLHTLTDEKFLTNPDFSDPED